MKVKLIPWKRSKCGRSTRNQKGSCTFISNDEFPWTTITANNTVTNSNTITVKDVIDLMSDMLSGEFIPSILFPSTDLVRICRQLPGFLSGISSLGATNDLPLLFHHFLSVGDRKFKYLMNLHVLHYRLVTNCVISVKEVQFSWSELKDVLRGTNWTMFWFPCPW